MAAERVRGLVTEQIHAYFIHTMSTVSVTIPESIRRRAQSLAQDDGVPLDQFIATALAEKIAVLDADRYLRERAARGSREKFERVLAMVPDVEPEEQDRISSMNAS
jgi:hypothetical protein